MHIRSREAFTMIELVFVIVIVGILSAIAFPMFTNTVAGAHLVKAKTTLITVRNALAIERQRRILKNDFTPIEDLGDDENVFGHMQADGNGTQTFIFQYPISGCVETERACWKRKDATHYIYRFSKLSDGAAKFVLQNNRLDCDEDVQNCSKIAQ